MPRKKEPNSLYTPDKAILDAIASAILQEWTREPRPEKGKRGTFVPLSSAYSVPVRVTDHGTVYLRFSVWAKPSQKAKAKSGPKGYSLEEVR